MSSIRPMSPGAAVAPGAGTPHAGPQRRDGAEFAAALSAGGAGDRPADADAEAPPRGKRRSRPPQGAPDPRRGGRLDLRI